jgi:hypothetical protein
LSLALPFSQISIPPLQYYAISKSELVFATTRLHHHFSYSLIQHSSINPTSLSTALVQQGAFVPKASDSRSML